MRVPTTRLQNAFGKYFKLVLEGQEIIVTKNGKGVAKIDKHMDPKVSIVSEEVGNYEVESYMTYEEFVKITDSSDARHELIDGENFL
ncbi:type II toxin-antitoxin system prevent-host-death family antitoxin [Acidaminobacter sp. JC074]|uniref:type II toxin-antitoxin system Phd/YefM family antitoxin n=1 Tax=Acidaminobacter sp. JC074 TaxID=2530199 RepID=UPI001F0DB9EA|nr:type II toxin-antitoxin system prevent-host-death family antitoxin [Acidaminobacter sp. JC074]MCH4886343.1 type II toxin-antitoxin system prevent-host-death family antitoxin [Acidaminobacter sp. JC074]